MSADQSIPPVPHSDAAGIDDLLIEEREFAPPAEFSAAATVADKSLYEQAHSDWEGYWAAQARELDWFEPWHTVLQWEPPHSQWFLGGKLNLSHNCLDRHLNSWRRNKAAIIWEGEPHQPGHPGEEITLTYSQLHRQVCLFANVLKGLGVVKGDRVAIYLPMVPEAAIAMLACARIGAVHSVVFGGFSAESLSDRINDCQCKLVITADGGWRRGRALQLKAEVDKALVSCPSVEHVVVVQRSHGQHFPCHMHGPRDQWWHELMAESSADCPAEALDSEDLLYILYTSGTTGKPKGIVHSTGGYSVVVHNTCKYVFDLQETDVFWCTADVGWVTGHSYVVYGPLQCGATVLMYEGAPDWPAQDRFWDIIERRGVTVFYTAPTAIRAFMKWGTQHPAGHDMKSLRLLGSVGEPINPEAWVWYHEHIGGGRCPIVDTWWQTETGGIMITTLPGLHVSKPGYAGYALPGIAATIVNEKAQEVGFAATSSASGLLCITRPWPSMLRTIWGDDERFQETYFSKWKDADGQPRRDLYFPGDGAKRDSDGRFMILGRVDDVLNVAGHRIGTMEVESALVDHPAVAEAAVVGRSHEIKGQALVAFVTLKGGLAHSDTIIDDLKAHVTMKIGAIARPEEIILTADLPKTRSGKIMRRLLRDIAEGRTLGDTTTLADPAVVENLRQMYEGTE